MKNDSIAIQLAIETFKNAGFIVIRKPYVEKPHEGIRVSRTRATQKYPSFEIITFPEAYNQWYQARQMVKK
jgi:hypothetical protein